MGPGGGYPCGAAASFMLLLTHCRLMSKRGRCLSLRWNDFRFANDSTRSACTDASSGVK